MSFDFKVGVVRKNDAKVGNVSANLSKKAQVVKKNIFREALPLFYLEMAIFFNLS